MKGKKILITGASSGIGRESALYLSSQGGEVILVGRNEDRLRETASAIGKNACFFPCDLRKLGEIEKIFEFCASREILLDGMVHSAGLANPTPVRAISPENVEEIMRVNFQAFVELGKQFYKRKYSGEGSCIIGISSLAAVRPSKGQVAYAPSKAALNSAMEVMAQEFLKRKIRVNTIMPSYVATPMVSQDAGFGMNQGIDKMPLGVIDPKQIAYLIEFLLSEKAAHITGAAIPVTSGV